MYVSVKIKLLLGVLFNIETVNFPESHTNRVVVGFNCSAAGRFGV